MKASFLLLMMGGAFLVTPTSHAEPLDHRITEVTVYRDRALITRDGSISLTPGIHEIAFERLPNALDENSVRAGGEGTARFKILGVELRRQYHKPNLDSAVAQLQERLLQLDDRRNAISDQRTTLHQQQQFLQRMRDKVLTDTQKVSQDSQLVSAKSLEEIFTFYSGELGKISQSLRTLQLEERGLTKDRQELQKQISLLQRPSDPDTRSAIVKVEVTRGGSAQFRLSYLMRGATWTPQYDAFARTKDQKVSMTYYGIVKQTTGESWKDVKLSLSTARPNQSARLPVLSTWTIDLAKPIVMTKPTQPSLPTSNISNLNFAEKAESWRQRTEGLAKPGRGFDRENRLADELPAEAASDKFATLVDRGPVATFEVPGTVTIPSDGQTHRTTIDQLAFKSDFAYEATPKLAEAAYLRATATNSSGVPLLPGKINVFQGNDFIGQSRLGLVAPAAKFDLYLGVDDGIKITRETKVPKEKIGGMLTAVKQYEFGYSIKVENFKPKAEKIIIHDQLPISKNGDVKVTIEEMTGKAKHDKETGEVTWEFTLAPQKDKELIVNYEVSCPPDAQIAGI